MSEENCQEPGIPIMTALKAIGACFIFSFITYKMGEYTEEKRHEQTRLQLIRARSRINNLQRNNAEQTNRSNNLQMELNRVNNDLAKSREETESVKRDKSEKERYYDKRYGREYETSSKMVDYMAALARTASNR